MADYGGAYYINIKTGTGFHSICAKCTDSLLNTYSERGGKLAEMADKVIKIPEELYRKVRAKSDNEGISMAKALGTIVDGKPMPEDIEAFIPSCAVELGVKMPKDYRWIKPLTEVLPVGLRGKLEPYAEVLDCAEAKAELKKLAEEHLGEVSEVSEGEVSEGEVSEVTEPELEPVTD